MLKLRVAHREDLAELCALYQEICEAQTEAAPGGSWDFGVYPTEDDLTLHIEHEDIYVLEAEARLVAVAVLSIGEDELYEGLPWSFEADSDKVGVVHLLGVRPAERGQGYAKVLLQELDQKARELGLHCIHLDVMPDNEAALKLYLSCGYSSIGRHILHYEDLGPTPMFLLEKVLV